MGPRPMTAVLMLLALVIPAAMALTQRPEAPPGETPRLLLYSAAKLDAPLPYSLGVAIAQAASPPQWEPVDAALPRPKMFLLGRSSQKRWRAWNRDARG